MNKEYKTSDAQRKAVKKWTEEHKERKKELDRLHNIRRRERIKKEHQELMKLQNNWNELKKIIEQDIRQCEELIEECPKGLRNTIIGTGSYEGIIGYNKYILSKMQELGQGKDE